MRVFRFDDQSRDFKFTHGIAHITASSRGQAKRQAEGLDRDLNKRIPVVRQQTEVMPGVFVLGAMALKKIKPDGVYEYA